MYKKIFNIFYLTILIAFISIVIITFNNDIVTKKVSGTSMMPTYKPEEGITCKKYKKKEDLKRGNIIIFNRSIIVDNSEVSREYIKRIIAIPSDEILFTKGSVILNHRSLNEPYSKGPTNLWVNGFVKEGKAILVPSNKLFVMGDNRPKSSDSREYGFVDYSDITCYIPQNNEKLEKISKYEKDMANRDINYLLSNYFLVHANKDGVDIDSVISQSSRVSALKNIVENKYNDKLEKNDYESLIDKLNREIIFSKKIINKWMIDQPLNDMNDFTTWDMIISLDEEARAILNQYKF